MGISAVTDARTLTDGPRTPPAGRQHLPAHLLSKAERLVRGGLWREYLAGLSDEAAAFALYDWSLWSRPAQQRPPSVGVDHRVWMVRAGRGFGKTRIGAEETREAAEHYARIALIAPTAADVRDVMVEGESGILSVFPRSERPEFQPSRRRITFHTGARAYLYSAEEPERLRGPQHGWAWGDEPASWGQGEAVKDNLMFGLRQGQSPWLLLTGTPKPVKWLRDFTSGPDCVTTTGSTFDNLANLAPTFIADMLDRYDGTRLGRQELWAEWLGDVEGALWVESLLDRYRWDTWSVEQSGSRVLVAVDPPGETAECGIVVAAGPARAVGTSHAAVLDDLSLAGRPEQWGAQVVHAWRKWSADAVYVESNQGGDMVRAVIHAVDPSVPVRKVRAVVSKKERAEPVSALYERGRVHHVGRFPMLESQMLTWVPDVSKSPDRVDALVHAITELLPQANTAASVTSVAKVRMRTA